MALPAAAEDLKIFGTFFNEVTKLPSVFKCEFLRVRYGRPSAIECSLGKGRTGKLWMQSRGDTSARVGWYSLTWAYKGDLAALADHPDRAAVLTALRKLVKKFTPGAYQKVQALFLGDRYQKLEIAGIKYQMFKPSRDKASGVVTRSICLQEIGAGKFC